MPGKTRVGIYTTNFQAYEVMGAGIFPHLDLTRCIIMITLGQVLTKKSLSHAHMHISALLFNENCLLSSTSYCYDYLQYVF